MDIAAIGRQFGLNEEQTRAAIEALAPVVAAGVRRNAQSPDGLQDIFRSVLTGDRARTLDDEASIQFDNAKGPGDDILGQIFGDKDVSRGVANQLSASSGIGAALLKKLLPIVASIVMGQVAKKMGAGGASGGGLGDILGDVLGGGTRKPAPQPQGGTGGGLGDILKDVLGGGTREAQQPAPMPRGDASRPSSGNPLEDMLNDILGGGAQNGRVIVKQIPPDQMGDILKDIFGGQFPGGGQGMPQQRRPIPEEAVTRGRRTLDDLTGGGTPRGDAADVLLDGVEKAIRRR